MDLISLAEYQQMMVDWVRSRLGEDAMRWHERGMRFGEESFELLQATGITKEECMKLLDHVYSKEAGKIEQEVGGVVTTLLTLADSLNVETSIATANEIDRIHSLPPEKFQKRQALNAELGIGQEGKQ